MVLAKPEIIAAATTGSAISQEGGDPDAHSVMRGFSLSALNIILHACVTIIAKAAARSAARRSSFRPLLRRDDRHLACADGRAYPERSLSGLSPMPL
jgi:hypothetical protein